MRRPVRIAVHTNVLVRYLTWDDEGQAIEAATAIEAADAMLEPTIVLCELVSVLQRAYRLPARRSSKSSAASSPSVRSKSTVPPPRLESRCSRVATTLPTASSGTMPTVPNAIASSHSTRASRGSSVLARLRFWEPGPRRDARLRSAAAQGSAAGRLRAAA